MKTAFTAALWVALCSLQPAVAEVMVIPGGGAPEVLLQQLAHAFNAGNYGHQVTIPPSSGSAGGLRAVESHESVLGRVARPLKESEAKMGLRYLAFAKDAVVFVVGADVKVSNLSTAQLVDIFSGKITHWDQVGGHAARIRVLYREQTETSFGVIKRHLTPFQTLSFSEQAKLVYRDFEMLKMLDEFGAAVGWLTHSTLVEATTALKPLSLDNIPPTPENLAAGKYPLEHTFALVYKEDRLNDAARKFIDFIFSDAGRKVLQKNGALPLSKT